MDQVLRGLPFVYDYIDDILVASPTKSTWCTSVKSAIAQRT